MDVQDTFYNKDEYVETVRFIHHIFQITKLKFVFV